MGGKKMLAVASIIYLCLSAVQTTVAGQLYVCGSEKLYRIDTVTDKAEPVCALPLSNVSNCLVTNAEHTRAWLGGQMGIVCLDLKSGKTVAVSNPGIVSRNCMALSADESCLYVLFRPLFWDITKPESQITGGGGTIGAVLDPTTLAITHAVAMEDTLALDAALADGGKVVGWARGGRVIDFLNRKVLREGVPGGLHSWCITFSPQRDKLYWPWQTGGVVVDLRTFEWRQLVFEGGVGKGSAVSWDGKRLYQVFNELVVTDLETGRALARRQLRWTHLDVAVSPDDKKIYLPIGEEIEVCDAMTLQPLRTIQAVGGHIFTVP